MFILFLRTYAGDNYEDLSQQLQEVCAAKKII